MPAKAGKMVLALAVFAAVGVILLGPIAASVNQNTGTQSVVNESHTVEFGTAIELDGYDIDSGSETVRAFNNTTDTFVVVDQAGNYTIQESAGTIRLNSTDTEFHEGEEFLVSYTYQASDPLTTTVVGFIPLGVGLLIFVGISSRVMEMV